MIQYLGSRHNLTFMSFLSQGQDWNRKDALRWCTAVHTVPYGGPPFAGAEELPYLVRRRASERMQSALRSLAAEAFDAVFLEQIFLAPYVDVTPAPVILGEHNIESQLLGRAVASGLQPLAQYGVADSADEARRMRAFEDRMWQRFPVRTAVSELERQEIQDRARTGHTLLAENGTNPDLWLPHARRDTNALLFTGLLNFYPNIDAVLYFWDQIWPHVRRRDTACRLIVAGRSPDKAICALRDQPGFTLVENPMDIRPVAARATASIVPVRIGAGSRIKVLDSMALGLPVISTSAGCAGLAVADGEHLLIRDDPEAFADAIVDVLRDAAAWHRLRRNGRRLIEDRYRWERTLRPLDEALRIAASRQSAAN